MIEHRYKKSDKFLKLYILWEQELLRSIGFEISPDNKNFNFYKDSNKNWIFQIDNNKFSYPNFLIDTTANYDDRDLYKGFVINKFIMKKFTFLMTLLSSFIKSAKSNSCQLSSFRVSFSICVLTEKYFINLLV